MEQSQTSAPGFAEVRPTGAMAEQALRPDSRRTMLLAFGFLAAGVAFTMSWVGLLAYGVVQFAVRAFPGG